MFLLLITAQEVAGLNPAEVTENQLFTGLVFFYGIQISILLLMTTVLVALTQLKHKERLKYLSLGY